MPETRAPVVDSEKLGGTRVMERRRSNTKLSQKTAPPRWNTKGKETSTIARLCSWLVDHQISISVTSLSTLALVHQLFPEARSHTRKFFSISYYNTSTGTYALGWDDMCFVFYWIVVFTGLRCAVMSYLLMPMAKAFGLDKPRSITRFAEQAWILIYPVFSWSVGMYIMYNSDYWLDLRALWKNWPQREMDGWTKWYYLVQFAFWLQQIVVVNIEERRKDHWQMFSHHLITCALIFGSYGYHWSKVGNLILCLMDAVDVFLPLAKILKYLKFEAACNVAFIAFMVTWFIARHVFYMWVVWSAYVHTPQEIEFGCYKGSVGNLTGPHPVPNDWKHVIEPFMDPAGSVCFNRNVQWTFISMLLGLQLILLVWLGMIIRVAFKVVTGQETKDVRSDGEESEEEDEKEDVDADIDAITNTRELLEKEVLSTEPTFTVSQSKIRSATVSRSPMGRSTRRKADGHASGVNLLAGSDRKELLGRIGCDKGSDHS